MKLAHVSECVRNILAAVPELSGIDVLTSASVDFNQRMEGALSRSGVVIVLMQPSGEALNAKAPCLQLSNSVVVSVVENPVRNNTPHTCLAYVEAILSAVHQHTWPTRRGVQNELTVDKPAYEAGPLEGGLVTYFCNFLITSTQTA